MQFPASKGTHHMWEPEFGPNMSDEDSGVTVLDVSRSHSMILFTVPLHHIRLEARKWHEHKMTIQDEKYDARIQLLLIKPKGHLKDVSHFQARKYDVEIQKEKHLKLVMHSKTCKQSIMILFQQNRRLYRFNWSMKVWVGKLQMTLKPAVKTARTNLDETDNYAINVIMFETFRKGYWLFNLKSSTKHFHSFGVSKQNYNNT